MFIVNLRRVRKIPGTVAEVMRIFEDNFAAETLCERAETGIEVWDESSGEISG